MDKYQESILKLIGFDFRTASNEMGSAKLKDDVLELTQNENYNLKDYILKICNVAVIKLVIDGCANNGASVNVSFDSKPNSLTLYLENNIVSPIELKLSYIEAKKDIYDAKISKAKADEYIEKASIKCSTGPSLVNIYFQPCDDKCSYTRIKLYTAKGHFDDGLHGGCCVIPPDWKPTLVSGEIEQMIGNYKVEEGALFKSISGLANGVYGYTVSQYDKNDNLLFETKPKYFDIG